MQDVNTVNNFFLGTSIFCIFLLFGISNFIWQIIPFFQYIEFPSRWLNINAFSVIFLLSSISRAFIDIYENKKEKKFLIIFLILICLLLSYILLLDYKYIRYANTFTKKEITDSLKVGYASKGHLPLGVEIDNISNDNFEQKVLIIGTRSGLKIVKWESARRIIQIEAEEPVVAKIRNFYFPGWNAYINGTEIKIRTGPDSSAMLIDVPMGSHTLELNFVDTPIRRYSKLISLISILGIIFALIIFKKQSTILRLQK
jgi:uncharacterized membrane protein YfhO